MNKNEMVMVGLGLMGTSLIKALKETTNLWVAGLDIKREPLQRALADQVLQESAVLGEEEEKVRAILTNSRFIVLALYPDGILDFIDMYIDCFQKDTIIMDICGLKGAFVEEAQRRLPEGVEYVGTHPMAGKEKSGYENGDSELFLGASFIITPTAQNRPETLHLIRRMAVAVGCGRIREIAPKEHDRIIAYTSQLPHVMAAALIRSWDGDEDVVSYTGGSFRDATRVAEINTKLWTQLFCYNRKELRAELEKYQKQLSIFMELLEQKDEEQMDHFLKAASERKIAWKTKGDRYDGGRG